MRPSLVGGGGRTGYNASSSGSSSSGSSSGVATRCVTPAVRPLNGRRATCAKASFLQHPAPKDPPSAYQALRQQLADRGEQQHVSSSSSSSEVQPQQQGASKSQQQQQQGNASATLPSKASSSKAAHPHWPRAVDDVCKAISSRLKQAGSAAAVLQVVHHHAPQFNAINTALAFAQLARHLRFDSSSGRTATLQHGCYATLQGLALQQAPHLNPRQLAMVLTSLAWMHSAAAHDDAQQQQQIMIAVPPATAVPVVTPQQLQPANANDDGSGGADAASPLQQQQQQEKNEGDNVLSLSPLLLQLLCDLLQQLLDVLEPEDTCHCLWALTKLDALPADLLHVATAHSLSRGWLQLLTAKPLSSLLWVHAQAHLKHKHYQQQQQQQQQETTAGIAQSAGEQQQQQPSLCDALVSGVMFELGQPGFLATWTPQELSMLLWSCAVLGVTLEQQQPQKQQLQHTQVAVQEQQQQQQQQQQSPGDKLPQASSRRPVAAVMPVSVLQQVVDLSRRHVVQFTPQGVAMVCWSLTQLLTASAADSGAAMLQQQQQCLSLPLHLRQQQPQQQQKLHLPGASGGEPVELQRDVAALFNTFTSAAASRLQYYKPQEVANLFTACTKLQLVPAGFRAAVESYIVSHTHLLGCRDIVDLLLSAAQQQQQAGLDAVAVRALLHRLGQLVADLDAFQLAAAAWSCARLSEVHSPAATAHSSRSSSSSSSRGSNGTSTLQEDCCVASSMLLSTLDSRLRQQATAAAGPAAVDAAHAVGAAAVDATSCAAVQSAWDALMMQGDAVDIKQAVAVAWALATTATAPGTASGSVAADGSAGSRSSGSSSGAGHCSSSLLLQAVLQQLHKGVEQCDAQALVQVLCVLLRLCTAYPSIVSTTGAAMSPQERQHHQQQRHNSVVVQQLMQRVHGLAAARLQLVQLTHLSPVAAATAAWGTIKLQVLLGDSTGPQDQRRSTAAVSTHVLSAVLQQLHERQQLSRLPGHSVAALLWCCKAGRWVPPADVYAGLLQAADDKVLQMVPHQQVVVLQALAFAADAGVHVITQQPQQLQQLQRQEARLAQAVVEQLQQQLYQQSLRLAWRQPTTTAAAASTAHGPSSRAAVLHTGLQPHQLVAVVQACGAGCLSQPQQQSQLLLQVVEVWQLLQQQGAVCPHDTLMMVWHLADVVPNSPAQPWHKAVLAQQQQQQAGITGLSAVVPQLLHSAVDDLTAALAVNNSMQEQQHHHQALRAQTLVLALRVFAKLGYQASSQVLSPLLQQVQAMLPVMTEADITAAVAATAQLGVQAPKLLMAAMAELLQRQRYPRHNHQQHMAGSGAGSLLRHPDEAGSTAAAAAGWQGRPGPQSLSTLWAVLSCGLQVPAGACRSLTKMRSVVALLIKLAHDAAGIPQDQLLRQPHLLVLAQQVRHMLRHARQYRHLQLALNRCGVRLPQDMHMPWLRRMSHVLLPKGLAGHDRQQAILQLMHADQHQHQHQQKLLLEQRLQSARDHLELPQQQVEPQVMAALLPLWLQHELQKQSQQQLARHLLVALRAAAARELKVTEKLARFSSSRRKKQAFARRLQQLRQRGGVNAAVPRVQLRRMAAGEVVLLLRPQQQAVAVPPLQQQQQQQQTAALDGHEADGVAAAACSSSRMSSNPPGWKGVAVVLEAPTSVSVNTGRLLGAALNRDAVLRAEGYTVLAAPLQAWLPDFIMQQRHSAQLAQHQHDPRRQQHLRHIQCKAVIKLKALRRRQVQQLLEQWAQQCSGAGLA